MEMVKYYVDTCIWLNLFKREGDPNKGIPFWRIADIFFEEVRKIGGVVILYSGVVLRELEIKLQPEEYREKRKLLEHNPICIKMEVLHADRAVARKLESQYHFEISFYDILHMLLTKRAGAILVTRDRRLIAMAREQGVNVKRPEELIAH